MIIHWVPRGLPIHIAGELRGCGAPSDLEDCRAVSRGRRTSRATALGNSVMDERTHCTVVELSSISRKQTRPTRTLAVPVLILPNS